MSAPMITVQRRPVDWFRVIVDLEREGYTIGLIATVTGCGKGTVGGWKYLEHGPSHENGEMLIALWMQVTARPRSELPRQLPQLSAARVR